MIEAIEALSKKIEHAEDAVSAAHRDVEDMKLRLANATSYLEGLRTARSIVVVIADKQAKQ